MQQVFIVQTWQGGRWVDSGQYAPNEKALATKFSQYRKTMGFRTRVILVSK